MTPAHDAATVIVARDASDGPHVLLLRRSARSSSFAGLWVFPGGAVDPADARDAQRLLRGSAGDVEPAIALAAARETFEEAGILFADRPVAAAALLEARRALLAGETTFAQALDALGVAVDARALRYFSRWITPEPEPRRFDARFFVARLPADQIAEADAAEVHDGRWIRPSDALSAHARGEFNLIFPTIKHLERIAPFPTVDALLAFAASKPIVTVLPTLREAREIFMDSELENAW